VAITRRRCPAPLGRKARHARTTEAIKDNVARSCVVEDGRDDCEMGNLGVVPVRPVELIGLAHTDVDRERLAFVVFNRVIDPAIDSDEVLKERVGAGREVRRIGHAQDRLVAPNGEAGCLAECRVLQLLREDPMEVRPAIRFALKGKTEALHRTVIHVCLREAEAGLLRLRLLPHLQPSPLRVSALSKYIRSFPPSCSPASGSLSAPLTIEP